MPVSALISIDLDKLPIQQILTVYDLLPDTLFWIKDRSSKIVHANRVFLEHIGVDNLEQVAGLTDYDFAPAHIAQQFIEDDKRVIKGEVVTDRLEMNILESGETCWFSTSKRPLHDASNNIIGSYGISRHLEKTSIALIGIEALKTPINYIRANYMYDINLTQLADISHLSISALERRFKKFLFKTPKQYITDVRLENARRLLVETTIPISTVADMSGFNDSSYFSRRFRRKFAQLPSEFRNNHQPKAQ